MIGRHISARPGTTDSFERYLDCRDGDAGGCPHPEFPQPAAGAGGPSAVVLRCLCRCPWFYRAV